MSSPACCPRPQSSSSPVHSPYPIQDSPQWFHPRSPGTVGQHRSELLITSRSLSIPITHLLPAVAHRLSINTCVQLSLRLCGSIHNRRLDQHRTKSMSSSDPFQEIVDQLKRTFTIMNTATNSTSVTSTTSSSTNSPGMVSPMVRPAPYSGRAEDCNGFLLQCSLTFEMQPHLFPTERAKIAFIISLLQGKALQWAETIWGQAGTITHSLHKSSPGCFWRFCQGLDSW